MTSEALRVPVAAGANVTPIEQLAPAATLLPQLFVWAKSPELAPMRAMLETLREALPMFESVTLCAVLVEPIFSRLNVRLGGERLTMGAGAGGELPPPPPPPPQATQTPTTNAAADSRTAALRLAAERFTSIARASDAAKSQDTPLGKGKLGGALRCVLGSVALTWAELSTVSVTVAGEAPATLIIEGENPQDNPEDKGALQDMLTVPPNPYRGVMVSVAVADCPGAEMLNVVGFVNKPKSPTSIWYGTGHVAGT